MCNHVNSTKLTVFVNCIIKLFFIFILNYYYYVVWLETHTLQITLATPFKSDIAGYTNGESGRGRNWVIHIRKGPTLVH